MNQLSDRDIACARLIRKRGQGTQWRLNLIARQLERMTAQQVQALAEKEFHERPHQEGTDNEA